MKLAPFETILSAFESSRRDLPHGTLRTRKFLHQKIKFCENM